MSEVGIPFCRCSVLAQFHSRWFFLYLERIDYDMKLKFSTICVQKYRLTSSRVKSVYYIHWSDRVVQLRSAPMYSALGVCVRWGGMCLYRLVDCCFFILKLPDYVDVTALKNIAQIQHIDSYLKSNISPLWLSLFSSTSLNGVQMPNNLQFCTECN